MAEVILEKLDALELELTGLKQDLQLSMQETMLLLSRKEQEMERWGKLSVLLGWSKDSRHMPATAKTHTINTENQKVVPQCLNIVHCAAAAGVLRTPTVVPYNETTDESISSSSSTLEQQSHETFSNNSASSHARMDRIRQATVQRESKIRNLLDDMKDRLNHQKNANGITGTGTDVIRKDAEDGSAETH